MSPSMPHATSSHDSQEELDDILIQQALDPENPIDFNRELEPGEKADDAIDFGDLSDDDLAADEDEGRSLQEFSGQAENVKAGFKGSGSTIQDERALNLIHGDSHEGDGFDDLFGDIPSSPLDIQRESNGLQLSPKTTAIDGSFEFEEDPRFQGDPNAVLESTQPSVTNRSVFRQVSFDPKNAALSREQQLQQELFAMSGSGLGGMDFLPAPPENQEELLLSLWPKFERGTILKFMDLLPPKKTRYIGKKHLKRPRIIQPTKLNLDLAPDQEKTFKISAPSGRKTQDDTDNPCIVFVPDPVLQRNASDRSEDMESDYENEHIGGVSWSDLQMVCEQWDDHDSPTSFGPSPGFNVESQQDGLHILKRGYQDVSDLSENSINKKRKSFHVHDDILHPPKFHLSSLKDPEITTSRLAQSVTLDLNDLKLLVDTDRPDIIERRSLQRTQHGERGVFAKGLGQRYNISNDDAYDLLKENHQSKIRSTLGTLAVEHSTPAIRLQWPYYKTKLEKQEARSFHRPIIKFQRNEQIAFSRPRTVKKKHLKGKDTQSIFASTRDLSLGDNSNVLLLEYSEEYPAMMSNFGMGNRLINYYRRKNMEDVSRPKLEIGETAVLLPQDKSPFSVFGHIDPGQITPALYNGMFKAPLFRQEAKITDFLVIRNTTGVEGPSWYIRNIDNLHVVGQEFPSVDVPGPHSRKFTTASKNRLKMISYRQIRRKPIHRISVAEVTKHFTDTTDMQNRQKMKEFMQFSKEHKEWEMRPGDAIPDEETVRALVKPEDVCLLESMQVGEQRLQDAGFDKADDGSEDDEGKEGKEGLSIEEQLAPWCTTRNFINAAQGKAMLQLHGEGDPSGRGEAFSFIKTSMKGGFKAMGESVEDKLDAKKLKELGGHSYNVARQQKSYEESIRRIWDAQRQSLSSTLEQSDVEMDEDHIEELDDFYGGPRTPRSEAQTPAAFRRRDDETTSQLSRFSTDSQTGKVLRITREIRDDNGNLKRDHQEIIRDPRVIRQYLKRRHAKEAENTKISELVPTGDAEQDRRNQQRLERELVRLQRNKERRIARDKQKGLHVDGNAESPISPASPAAAPVQKGTQRKCANCGQVGHIKTNKKLCSMLNGTMKQEESLTDSAFMMGAPL